jgi:hypothetical protein
MPDLSAYPKLDKQALIGSCLKLPVIYDTQRLIDEFHSIDGQLWGTRGGRVGVHVQAEAIFLRGHAPVEGALPIEDREVTASLPFTTQLIHQLLKAQPLRCLFAKLQPNGAVPIHIDNGEYFEKTIRIHFPIVTNPQATMIAGGKAFHMRVGEVWALNNNDTHGVLNQHEAQARTHLICDYLPNADLLSLLARGERNLGTRMQ